MSQKIIDIRKAWSNEEDQAILLIVEQIGVKSWPLVSQLMKEKYNLISRSGKQCRERWHNQLCPQLNKRPWGEDQQQQLFQAHRKYGNRWIQISKQFGGRTDNSIKNHFYSTIRRSMRRICKLLGNRNSTSKLRDIRPSVLSEIFEFSKTQQMKSLNNGQNDDIATCLLTYAKQKLGKTCDFDPDSKSDLQILVKRLIFLNDQYVSFKLKKKISSGKSKNQQKQTKKLKIKRQSYVRQQQAQTNIFSSQSQVTQKQQQQKIQHFLPQQTEQKSINQQWQDQHEWTNHEYSEQENSMKMKIQNQELENEYLIIKNVSNNHIKMFDSISNITENQHQCFLYLKQPSFIQIDCIQYQASCENSF